MSCRRPVHFLGLLLCASIAGSTPAVAASPLATAGVAPSPVDALEQIGPELQALWLGRDTTGTAQIAVNRLEVLREDSPDDAQIYWELARFHYWLAATGPEAERSAHGEQGWLAGMEAHRLSPDSVEGSYWAAACVGAWARHASIPEAIGRGLPNRFEEAVELAMSLDPAFDDGGPLRMLGRYYSTLPMPFRRYDEARGYLERALRIAPDEPANLFFMADLTQREGDRDAARVVLDRLLTLEPETGDAPRIRRYQTRGRLLLDEIS